MTDARAPRRWDPTAHFAWRGGRVFGCRMSFARVAGFADHRSFEVIERRPDAFDRDHSRYWVRDTDCPTCRNTRWREIPERPVSLDYVHPYDMDGWGGTNFVTPQQWRATAELIVQAQRGGPDVFAYDWPPLRRPGLYDVFRGEERVGFGTDLRAAIGFATWRRGDRIVDAQDPECPPWARGGPCEACGAARWVHGALGVPQDGRPVDPS